MGTTFIETMKPQTDKTNKQMTNTKPTAIDDPLGAGDAIRFQGQPVVLFARLERAVNELAFYRTNLRHRNDGETSDPRSHDEWRRAAAALARELADEVDAGLLEPNLEIRRKLDMAQALMSEVERMQRGA